MALFYKQQILVLFSEDKIIKAESLWATSGAVIVAVRRPGWFLCREVTKMFWHVLEAWKVCLWQPHVLLQEASELSSLKPQLEELGVPLVAVVKENIGTEIQDFRPHFAGDIYIDEKVSASKDSLPQSHLYRFGWP